MKLRVQVVIDTDQLLWWAAKHQELGHQSVHTALAVAASHYSDVDAAGDEPAAPAYPAGLDGAELEQWARWHADHGAAGVAHILDAAAESARS